MATLSRIFLCLLAISACFTAGCNKPATKSQYTAFASSIPELPNRFPMDIIPIYPGAITHKASFDGGSLYLLLGSQDSMPKVVSYYTKYFNSNGWVPNHTRPTSTMDSILWSKDGEIIGLAYDANTPSLGSQVQFSW